MSDTPLTNAALDRAIAAVRTTSSGADARETAIRLITYHAAEMERDCARLRSDRAALLEACQAVIGRGYLHMKHPASQDYVSHGAIAKVRAAIKQVRFSQLGFQNRSINRGDE